MDDNWMDMDNISAGACYKLHDESDTNLGGLWLNRLELHQPESVREGAWSQAKPRTGQ